MRTGTNVATLLSVLMLVGVVLLSGCEPPPVESVQRGYRGTGMVEFGNPAALAAKVAANQMPVALAPASADGPKASEVFKNLQVLGDLSIGELTRTMAAITSWVSPTEGCAYCHVAGEDLAADTLYTKIVARQMLKMTKRVNAGWQDHVGVAGVTCYTCHRGAPVPANTWFSEVSPRQDARMLGNSAGQNKPGLQVGLTAMPGDPFSVFLGESNEIRVIGKSALPSGNLQSIKQTEGTYALMIHVSNALGVNCTYCHNSRSFADWDASTPQRSTAWYGIRMVRELNNSYLLPLTGVFPPNRIGPNGDVAKVNCTTCHQGAFKPMLGVSMLADYPELAKIGVAAAAPKP
jgi:photosynthetic reaction center cytochrome c subunit